jgi:hypothetical protein
MLFRNYQGGSFKMNQSDIDKFPLTVVEEALKELEAEQ